MQAGERAPRTGKRGPLPGSAVADVDEQAGDPLDESPVLVVQYQTHLGENPVEGVKGGRRAAGGGAAPA
jgi:hypothetical protein